MPPLLAWTSWQSDIEVFYQHNTAPVAGGHGRQQLELVLVPSALSPELSYWSSARF